jgi:hypothetical protein
MRGSIRNKWILHANILITLKNLNTIQNSLLFLEKRKDWFCNTDIYCGVQTRSILQATLCQYTVKPTPTIRICIGIILIFSHYLLIGLARCLLLSGFQTEILFVFPNACCMSHQSLPFWLDTRYNVRGRAQVMKPECLPNGNIIMKKTIVMDRRRS